MPPDYGSHTSDRDSWLRTTIEINESTPLIPRRVTDYWIPKRYLFSIHCFVACCFESAYNINLSITIVSMVYHSPKFEPMVDPVTNKTFNKSIEILPEDFWVQNNLVIWDENIQGLALGAVFWGQLISFLPFGRMAELYGGKRMLIICILIATFSTFLQPTAALWNPFAFIAARVVQGVGTGPIIPIQIYLFSKWIPDHERVFHSSFVLAGYGIGPFLLLMASGAMCESTFLGGWPSVFYVSASIGAFWCVVMFFFLYENPEDHPAISEEELNHIISGREALKGETIDSIPWKEMALSVPLWALAFAFFGQFWLLAFFSTDDALYIRTALNLPVSQIGLITGLPHLLRAIAMCVVSYPVYVLLKRGSISVKFVRMGATVANTVVSCCAFLGLTFVEGNIAAVTTLMILGGVLGEFISFGINLACIDIAPNLSGTVSGILNIVGVLPFLIVPSLVGWMTGYENSLEKWNNVFYTTIALVSISTLIFVIFGDVRPQPWGVINEGRKSETKTKREPSTDPQVEFCTCKSSKIQVFD